MKNYYFVSFAHDKGFGNTILVAEAKQGLPCFNLDGAERCIKDNAKQPLIWVSVLNWKELSKEEYEANKKK